jgi:hypothetical protein
MASYQTVNGSYSDTVANGAVLENLLVNAGGANVNIAVRDGGTLRNVAIVNQGRSPSGVSVRCGNGGNAVVDNCYFSGSRDNDIFINAAHSGHVNITNSYFEGAVEDAVYGSPPGNFPGFSGQGKDVGKGGTVHIDNCYAVACGDYGFRLGSTGSKISNSVMANCGVAAANLYGRQVEFENVQIY